MIGIACRCAGAGNAGQFWELLREGRDCIERIEAQDWLDFFAAHSKSPVPARYGRMGGKECFDAAFFGIGPEEAAAMDFPQRLLLEDAYTALEDAGIDPSSLRKRAVGVFIGSVGGGAQSADLTAHSLMATDTSVLASRIAYFLDLKGPALTINTACSSSLVAMDVACQYLRGGNIDLAIVGGATIYTDPRAFLMMNAAGMLSPTETCRPFDNGADGMVVGDGSAVLILKRLADAERDGDPVYGAIAAIGTNQNGQTAGLSVPSYLSQSALQASLYRDRGIDVEAIQYIETHGTGTKLGDPIEFDGLNHSFRQFTAQQRYCAIGSVKANIGHTTAASGALSVIKILLGFRHRLIPPTLNFTQGNEHIDFGHSPFYVNTRLREWPENPGKPRLAAVTSLGHSGTNAHAVLEEYRSGGESPGGARPEGFLVPLSAKTAASLKEAALRLAGFLRNNTALDLSALAYTLQTGRETMGYRGIFLVETLDELVLKLGLIGSQSPCGDPIENYWQGEGKPQDGSFSTTDSGPVPFPILAERWARGEKTNWRALYAGDPPRKLHLPTYVFAKTAAGLLEKSPEVATADENSNGHTLASLLKALLARQLECPAEQIDPERNYFELGLNSLGVVNLQKSLERITGRKIGAGPIFEHPTVARLSAHLQENPGGGFAGGSPAEYPKWLDEPPSVRSSARFPELLLLNENGRGRPVFWFHGGLGGVQPYHMLAEASERPFYGIQARGWMTEDPPIYGVKAMAAYYLEALQSVQPQGPYDLGGYSLGGLLAYEAARQLQERGEKVATIVMLDTFDTREVGEIRQSSKNDFLQAVNIALQTAVMGNPKAFSSILIHRDQLDTGLADEEFLRQLIALAKTRGLSYSEERIRRLIRKQSRVQGAHQAHLYEIPTLPEAGSIQCVYFRNRNGIYMGALEPYFSLEGCEYDLNNENHWRIWRERLPDFSMIDIEASNHLVLLAEPEPADTIVEFCRGFYSEPGVSQEFIRDFQRGIRA